MIIINDHVVNQTNQTHSGHWGSRGLMDRALDLKPKVVGSNPGSGRKCTTEVRPLSKVPNPRLLPGRCNVGCPLLHLDGLNAENTFHSSLYSV